jgi:hypothetical protein
VSAGAVISVVFPLLTLITGGACILLFSITTTLRANNGDLKDRVDILEKELKDERSDNAALRAEVGALHKVVTGEVQLAAIQTLLEAHDKSTVAEHARIEKAVDAVRGELATISGQAGP